MTKRHRRAPDELEQAVGQLLARSTAAAPAPPREAPSPPVMELTINLDLIERRKTVRTIPVPEALESNDEESWTAWDELTAQQDREFSKDSALAKLKQLIRRKEHGSQLH